MAATATAAAVAPRALRTTCSRTCAGGQSWRIFVSTRRARVQERERGSAKLEVELASTTTPKTTTALDGAEGGGIERAHDSSSPFVVVFFFFSPRSSERVKNLILKLVPHAIRKRVLVRAPGKSKSGPSSQLAEERREEKSQLWKIARNAGARERNCVIQLMF